MHSLKLIVSGLFLALGVLTIVFNWLYCWMNYRDRTRHYSMIFAVAPIFLTLASILSPYSWGWKLFLLAFLDPSVLLLVIVMPLSILRRKLG